MTKKQYGELQQGDKISVFGQIFVVKKIELSEKGVKQGRTKARVEAVNEEGQKKIIIRLAKEEVEVM
tara:strand:- start:810 stop:1010 length:201 start_codon:yes stop_codon:yes gene_type:complete